MSGLKKIIFRGLMRRCPYCGQGKIFEGYLTPKSECPVCYSDFSGIRTDDAAPWATILLVGHLMAPVVIVTIGMDIGTWALTALFMIVSMVFAAAALPIMKGLFFALNWHLGVRYDDPDEWLDDGETVSIKSS